MIIYPAIDIIDGKAVRLFKGDYEKKTEYGSPVDHALKFVSEGATHIHVVDLDGAKAGQAVNFATIAAIKRESGAFVETGGGIRNLETVRTYVDAGIDRVILGTSAVYDIEFLERAIELYGERIAVGADVKDGFIAVRGWLEKSTEDIYAFLDRMTKLGVKTIICTDVSKDGAMQGANVGLYGDLSAKFDLELIASGGVSSMEDVRKLKALGMSGAIIGKAYYSGAISLKEAIEVAK